MWKSYKLPKYQTYNQQSDPLSQIYNKNIQNFESLYEQLELTLKRHQKQKLYIGALKEQLNGGLKIALAELGAR